MVERRGKFFVADGIAGSGKSFLLKWLSSHWPVDRRNVLTREPGGTLVGEAIRYAVQSPKIPEKRCDLAQLLLYSASRAQLVHRIILPALKQGKDVLCDRYTSTTYAFQGQSLSKRLILDMNRLATGELLPDIWFHLTGDIGTLLRRKKNQKEGPGTDDDLWDLKPDWVEFMTKADLAYREFGLLYPNRWVTIMADGPVGSTINDVATVLEDREQIIVRFLPARHWSIGDW